MRRTGLRREVVEYYKGQHWHVLWHVRFTPCDHWGLAYSVKGGRPPKTAICDTCTKEKVAP